MVRMCLDHDSFLNISSTSTDLDMFYQKVGDVYDANTGRPIEPDFHLVNLISRQELKNIVLLVLKVNRLVFLPLNLVTDRHLLPQSQLI